MTVLGQLAIDQEQIKLRWREPYVSAALNNKHYTVLPRGFYRGFVVTPGASDHEVVVDTEVPTGIVDYESGNFDVAVSQGWSVAVHENLLGYTCTIIMKRGINSEYRFDLASYQGGIVYLALDVTYELGYATTAKVIACDDAELDANPTLLVIAKVEVPSGVPIAPSNIIYGDAAYPRILPFANPLKSGFMSKEQASIVDVLQNPTASNAFEEFVEVFAAGPQTITIPAAQQYAVGGFDLFIFRNGLKLIRDKDYSEIDRGDGFGNDVEFLGPLQVGDRLLFRGQAYAVALTNNLTVKDEFAQVQTGVTSMNFRGTGVTVIPSGAGQVDIIIPETGSGGGGSSKQKFNNTGTNIPSGRAVRLLNDGSVALFDPQDPAQKFYGFTNGIIVSGNYGFVDVAGVSQGTLTGLGFASGQVLYVEQNGSGQLTAVLPGPFTGQVVQVGIADCPDGALSSSATDLVFLVKEL